MTIDPASICVVANPGSGRNSRDAEAIDRAMAVFGPKAVLRRWTKGDDLDAFVHRAVSDGYSNIVAAGGDGTVMGVAHALMGKDARLGVLPLGTFNYFARGLGLPQEPEAAAQAILNGHLRTIAVSTVNDQLFLNNASLGIYPSILQAREDIYARWGRSRILAHWSVLRTIARFQRPMRMTLDLDGEEREIRTPLVFVARSAYQIDRFGLEGTHAIRDDQFAVFAVRGGSRWDLFRIAIRLATRRIRIGEDVDLYVASHIEARPRKRRPVVAFDGEKRRMLAPLDFRIHPESLTIIVPREADRVEV